jgi:hypothetical protein
MPQTFRFWRCEGLQLQRGVVELKGDSYYALARFLYFESHLKAIPGWHQDCA